VFIHYDEDPARMIYSTPCVEYPDLIKVALHTGPKCDPDTRSLVPNYEECEKFLSPWIPNFLKNVDAARPAVAEACMYTNTPDHNFILDRLPGELSGVVVGRVDTLHHVILQ
jgi:sarcosine oxidase/L-pipecolate oxidase